MSSEESKAEFPVRVALPIGDDGIRRDLEGRWSVWHNVNGWWITDGVLNCHLGTALDKIPTVLERLGIIDVREKVKAGAWERTHAGWWRVASGLAVLRADDTGRWSVQYAVPSPVGLDVRCVAKGQADSLDGARAAVDHYGVMLYDLEGGCVGDRRPKQGGETHAESLRGEVDALREEVAELRALVSP